MKTQQFACDTSTRTKKEWAQGLGVLFIGLAIAHFGVSLFVLTGVGSDPFTLFVQGLSVCSGLTIGTCHVAMLLLMMVAMHFTTKNYVKPGTIVCSFCGGWIIDVFMWLFQDYISADSSLLVRGLSLSIGIVIISFGISIVIQSNSGSGPNDLVYIILTDKLQSWKPVQYRTVRIACDATFVVLGILLGGVFGIGTVVAVFVTGPLVQLFLPISRKLIHSKFPTL